jgi:hypothetical protein
VAAKLIGGERRRQGTEVTGGQLDKEASQARLLRQVLRSAQDFGGGIVPFAPLKVTPAERLNIARLAQIPRCAKNAC